MNIDDLMQMTIPETLDEFEALEIKLAVLQGEWNMLYKWLGKCYDKEVSEINKGSDSAEARSLAFVEVKRMMEYLKTGKTMAVEFNVPKP